MKPVHQVLQATTTSLFPWQIEALNGWADILVNDWNPTPARACLFFKTGAGKSLTAAMMMYQADVDSVLVVAPPVTHKAWTDLMALYVTDVTVISHAKFRQKDYKISRDTAVVVDEFHLLGGSKGIGFRKLHTLARYTKQPIVIASATPNYNDAERCYCVEAIVHPEGTRGGLIEFIYKHCTTERNPFGIMPKVIGFSNHANAAEYLAGVPNVMFLADDVQYTIVDHPMLLQIEHEFYDLRLDHRRHRVMASLIEIRHAQTRLNHLRDNGTYRGDVFKKILRLMNRERALLFCNSAVVATALHAKLINEGYAGDVELITGKTTKAFKEKYAEMFLSGRRRILIGTASLATGLDGLDKVCDTLIIVDDTDDNSLRRQLVGRILPRGGNVDNKTKRIHRLIFK